MGLFGGNSGSSRPSNRSNPTGGQRSGLGGLADRAQAGLRSVGNSLRSMPGATGQGGNHFAAPRNALSQQHGANEVATGGGYYRDITKPVMSAGLGSRAPMAPRPQAAPVGLDPAMMAFFNSKPRAGLGNQPMGNPDMEAAEAWKARYGSYPRWFKG